MMNVKETMERIYLPALYEASLQIAQRFADVNSAVTSFPIGGLTDNKGYIIALECLLTKASLGHTDNVALDITVEHINTHPVVNAGVSWGHPSGYLEAEVFTESVPFSDNAIEEIKNQLPMLIKALNEALTRGIPQNECLDA